MARSIAAIVAHDDSVPQALVAAHIGQDAGIEIVATVGSLALSADDVRRTDADLLLIACRDQSSEALELVQWWNGARPGRPVLVLCREAEHEFVHSAFAAGADDVVVINPGPYVPEQARRDVEFAVSKAIARHRAGSDRAPDAGYVIGMLGPKGGTGKTVASTNLAVALAQRGRRTVLVDLDLQFGDVALALGLNPEVTIFDLAVSGGSLDATKLDDFLLRHPSGLRVLAAPVRPDQASSVSTDMIFDIYDLLRREYDFVVVDTPPAFEPEVIATIDAANALCVMAMLDALSLKNARLGLETLDLMGVEQDRVRVVLNRADSSVGISHNDAVAILGRRPDALIPSAEAVPRSLGEGVPLVSSQRRSEVARALDSLADLFAQTPPELVIADRRPRRKRRRGLVRRRQAAVVAGEIASGEV